MYTKFKKLKQLLFHGHIKTSFIKTNYYNYKTHFMDTLTIDIQFRSELVVTNYFFKAIRKKFRNNLRICQKINFFALNRNLQKDPVFFNKSNFILKNLFNYFFIYKNTNIDLFLKNNNKEINSQLFIKFIKKNNNYYNKYFYNIVLIIILINKKKYNKFNLKNLNAKT